MLNDTNYPGWHAAVNGAPVPILQANYLFRGVIVPAGRATVDFDYAPASFRVGTMISFASLIALLFPFFGRSVWRRRSNAVLRREVITGSGSMTSTALETYEPQRQPNSQSFDTNPERMSRMNSFDQLDIVIRRRSGKVLASIPQLHLYARGANVDAALVALEAKRAAFVAELEDAGELDTREIDHLLGTTAPAGAVSSPSDLRRFAIKTGIVALATAVVLIVSGVFVALSIGRVIGSVRSIKFGGAPFWMRVEQELDRMAGPQSNLPEATKQKLLADIRAIAVKWRPFVTEIQAALAGPDKPTPSTDQPSAK